MPLTLDASILVVMSELDDFWSEQLSAVAKSARTSGRAHVADYLSLKADNDAVRTVEIEKLFRSFIDLAMSDENRSKQLLIEKEAPHSFRHQNANLVGSLLRIRYGLRCMTIEAGWTRTPSDGFMRLGALAFARITHFGMPKANMELAAVWGNDGSRWQVVRDEKMELEFGSEHCSEHMAALIDV